MATTTVASAQQPTAARAQPRLSVIVPAHDNGAQLEQSLQALARSTHPAFEIIVVDDCSTDDLRPLAAAYGARYVRTPRNLGPAGARNLAAQTAAGDILVMVDADVCIDPGGLARIAQHFADDQDLAGVFGSYDEYPACDNFVSQMKNLMHHYVHQISSERACSFWAGCGALRKSVFLEFGGFDASRFSRPSIEDIELGFRMTQAGHRILLDKQLQGKHLKRWTVRNLLHADIFCRAVPWAKLILQSGHLPRDLNLTYAARISSVLVGLMALSVVALPVTAIFHWWPGWKTVAALIVIIAALLVGLNLRLYRWFAQRRGVRFAVGVVLFHWLYYFYSGVTFAVCALLYRRSRPRTEGAVAVPVIKTQD